MAAATKSRQHLVLGLVITALVVTVFVLPIKVNDPYTHSKDIIQKVLNSYTAYMSNLTELVDSLPTQMSLGKHIEPIDDDSIARKLQKSVRILIFVITHPAALKTRALSVKQTWGARADHIIYFSSKEDKDFPTIRLDAPEGKGNLNAKTMKALQYVYKHHYNHADWFMKADDDTYVIMENLRYFLSDKDSSEPVFYGKLFSTLVKHGFNSGGAGYVLSKEALRRIATNGSNPKTCKQDGAEEDVSLSRCLETLGVHTANSDDSLGRGRFHCFEPWEHIHGGSGGWWYNKIDTHKGRIGRDSISQYPITFHQVKGDSMITLDFTIYNIRLYGVQYGNLDLNPKPNRTLV